LFSSYPDDLTWDVLILEEFAQLSYHGELVKELKVIVVDKERFHYTK
jgi:hypothetical protein